MSVGNPGNTSGTNTGSYLINKLENDSRQDGVRGTVNGNGGNAPNAPKDGKIGRNDLQAIIQNGSTHGVSTEDIQLAKDLMAEFDANPDKNWIIAGPSNNPDYRGLSLIS